METNELPAGATLVVVTSKLRDPADRERFLAASRSFLAWLRDQPGFLRYELVRSVDGRFCDTMLWETPEHAEHANGRFEDTAIRAEFAAIVQDYRAFAGTIEELQVDNST